MPALLPLIFLRMRACIWVKGSAQRILTCVYAAKLHIALKRNENAVGGPMLLTSALTRRVHTAKSLIDLKRNENAVKNPMRSINPVCIVSIVEGPTGESTPNILQQRIYFFL
jgi:hypothetical protein